MFIQILPSGPFATNTYVVGCTKTSETAVIDPAPESFQKIQQFITEKKLYLKKILLTHSHWDHIADVRPLKEAYDVPVSVHASDAQNLRQPGSDGLPCMIKIPPVEPDILLADGMRIPIGLLNFEVIHTPGHSPGSVCYFEPQQSVLFSGDTLFQGSIGNLSFASSNPSHMWASLERLAQLPAQTNVYPGHGPQTKIEAESPWLSKAKWLFDR